MQTSLRRKHRDRVVRRGLALIIESDFYATDAGRQHFADQLTSIRCAARPSFHRRVRSIPPTLTVRVRASAQVLRPGDLQYAPRLEPHGPSHPLLTPLSVPAKTLTRCTLT